MSRSIALRSAGLAILALVAMTALAPALWAQNPTGTLTGRITDPQGGGLPGVLVTANSPALQGERTTMSSGNGDYKLAFLPPGTYDVVYTLDGFKTSVRSVKISAAQTTPSDVGMEIGEISEEIVVTSQQSLVSETGTGASTVTLEEIEKLAVDRDLVQAINLAPGVANSGFRDSAPSISGAPTFDNLWMINGVVINENIRSEILNLFIEDAVKETTTAVSGISAEYGRFTGGVVNAITKSGGNRFDGSVRLNLENEDWKSKTPLSDDRVDEINQIWEATLGGYFVKDHLWFFGAGRDRGLSESSQTDITNIQYPTSDDETRIEAKLTISPNASHSIIGSYLEIDRTRTNTDFGTILDLRSLNPQRGDPQEIQSINYTGILTDNFFIEAQYSKRDYIIGQGSGGPQDLIQGTLIRTKNEGFRYWAPTFCGECEDEQRDNENVLAKANYFLSTANGGTHDLAFGYDTFEDIRFVINHQTGSDWTVYGSDVIRDANGDPVLDNAFGTAIPVFDPDAPSTPWLRWFAVFNEDLAQPTSFKTNSFYVNDRWQLSDRWSFNLGVRWDQNDGVDSSGSKVADDDKLSPRLGASWDIKGDGDLVFNASYGTYVAALANGVADDSSNGGAIGTLRWDYAGPPINVGCTPNVDCLGADVVLQMLFDWYVSQGGVFDLDDIDPNAPINDYTNLLSIPGATLQVVTGISSPGVDELTFGLTKRLGTKGLVRGDLIFREWDDFYGDRTTLETGKVDTVGGLADVAWLGNFSTGIEREYRGLLTQFRYRFTPRFTLAGNYTLSKTEGNFLGETSNSGPIRASSEDYPEYREERWNYPKGDLRVDQRHKLRVWGIYDILQGERNRLSVSGLFNFFSGQPYAANANIDPRRYVDNPGYETPPSSVLYYYTARDAFRTDDISRFDLALNYSFLIPVGQRSVEIFLQPKIINVFNEDGVIDPQGLDDDEGVRNLTRFNPFTETPVEGVNWERRSTFGQPLNENDFQRPREYRFSVGVRF